MIDETVHPIEPTLLQYCQLMGWELKLTYRPHTNDWVADITHAAIFKVWFENSTRYQVIEQHTGPTIVAAITKLTEHITCIEKQALTTPDTRVKRVTLMDRKLPDGSAGVAIPQLLLPNIKQM